MFSGVDVGCCVVLWVEEMGLGWGRGFALYRGWLKIFCWLRFASRLVKRYWYFEALIVFLLHEYWNWGRYIQRKKKKKKRTKARQGKRKTKGTVWIHHQSMKSSFLHETQP
jgi:hypothetical protein